MAGIYIHIPFCKQACHYCNFHFSTSLRYKADFLEALHTEIALQKDYLMQQSVKSIYLGGGTPSLLDSKEINAIFDHLHQFYRIEEDAEITLEANPDDITETYLQSLRQTPINRLSIGIQSFSDADLRAMNRAHNAQEAKHCIQKAQAAGFHNLTIDLIYGSPTTSDKQWQENLAHVMELNVPHLSCYCLTVEPQTALARQVKLGKAKPVDEEQAARQFEYLQQVSKAAGYIHYEISNFAQAGCFAQHNSNYWKGVPYLGLGPSAHSFDGTSRQWNIANNAQYIRSLARQELCFEVEELTAAQRYNEYILTGLRTIWGCNLSKIRSFGTAFEQHFLKVAQSFLATQKMQVQEEQYSLTEAGKLLADHIALELFWEED